MNSAVGEAPASALDVVVEQLQEKRQALVAARDRYVAAKAIYDEREMAEQTRLVASLTVVVSDLEKAATLLLEQETTQRAEARVLGIRKAFGSVLNEYGEDKKRINHAVAALWEAISKLNARGKQLERLRDEAAALADRFGLATPKLPLVTEPEGDTDIDVSLPRFWRVKPVRPGVEMCEHNVRERRNYSEIAGSEGHWIIQQVGLKPFRELNEPERAVLEQTEKERNAPPDPVIAAEAAIIQAIPPGVSFADMGVYRG